MEASNKTTKPRQFEIMIEFMNKHSQLARGHLKTPNARQSANNLWQALTEELNINGPPLEKLKDGKSLIPYTDCALNNIAQHNNMSTSKVDNCCITELQTVSCSHKWTIKNMCFESVRRPITSDTFSVTVGDELNLKWELYLNNLDKTIGMGIRIISCNKRVEAFLKCTMLDNEDKERFNFNFKLEPLSPGSHLIKSFGKIYGVWFNILLEYTLTYGYSNTMRSQCPLPTVNECDLKPDFEKILEDTKFCDVTLKLRDGREIQSHKVILAARSEVFASMFEHEMKESKENCVEIMDLDGDVCEEMLRFIYTGKVPKLNEIMEQLLAVADKYNLEGLKTMCIQEILSKLSIESAGSVLYLADRYRLDQLNELVLEFLNTNAKEFIKSKEYHEICQDNPDLLIKLYKAAVSKN